MSFDKIKRSRFRISTRNRMKVERQLKTTFISCLTKMMENDYRQYIKDLEDEATDYWFGSRIGAAEPNQPRLYEFGFISSIDAMGFKLKWIK